MSRRTTRLIYMRLTRTPKSFKYSKRPRRSVLKGVDDIHGTLMLGKDGNFALTEVIRHLSVLVQQESGLRTPEAPQKNEWICDNPMVHSTKKFRLPPLFPVVGLRQYCNMVWKQVAPARNLNYVTASFVANMAVQTVKQMEYALVTDFPSPKHRPSLRLSDTMPSPDIGCWIITHRISLITSMAR